MARERGGLVVAIQCMLAVEPEAAYETLAPMLRDGIATDTDGFEHVRAWTILVCLHDVAEELGSADDLGTRRMWRRLDPRWQTTCEDVKRLVSEPERVASSLACCLWWIT